LEADLQSIQNLEQVILSRRSAREFVLESIKKEPLEQIMQFLLQLPQSILCHMVLMRSEAYRPGLYQGSCLKREGVFISEIVDLLVHQQFIFNASVVLVFSSDDFGAKILTQTAYFVHTLNLFIHAMGLGMSGVGAFYDKELQDFLQTQEKILYTAVLGNI
jgi:nitroreductase